MPKRYTPHHRNEGFTLVELSIVLIIIGLIVGAIFVGKDMIRAAEIRGMVSDVEKLKSAINTFRVKYNCLPGDCPNATDFMGAYAGCPTPPNSITAVGTCNGNGDGNYLPWQVESVLSGDQLMLANLWPRERLASLFGLFNLRGLKDMQFAYIYTDDLYGGVPYNRGLNSIVFGMSAGGCINGVVLEAINSQQVDNKLDDGRAGTGSVLGVGGQNPQVDCATSAPVSCVNAASEYDVKNPAAYCRMVIYW